MMQTQMGSLVSIMETARRADRDEMKQDIRAYEEHIKEIMEARFGSLDTKLDGWRGGAGRPRSEQDHGFEGKS
jgi:hypothetical protein